MKGCRHSFLFSVFIFFHISLFASNISMAKAKDTEIWYEAFGEKDRPSILLIMGGLCQGILWPTEFCEQLANEGFYVIRYDHRDAGYSKCVDYNKDPYDLLDMAKDAIGLLDYLNIEKTHLCGLSMGGPIAELMSVYFPERVYTMTLIATSCDFRPSSLAYEGLYPTDITLSRPTKIYLDWMHSFIQTPPQTIEEALEARVVAWQILNGPVAPFEEKRYREIHQEFLDRLKHPESLLNHLPAIKSSFTLIQTVPYQVQVPTLIFHGSEDPIFPPDHGEALAKAIKGSKYVFVQGMGHVINSCFYNLLIEKMKQHIQSSLLE